MHQKRRRGRAGRNIERKRDTFEFCIFFSKLICQGKKGKVIPMLLPAFIFRHCATFSFCVKAGSSQQLLFFRGGRRTIKIKDRTNPFLRYFLSYPRRDFNFSKAIEKILPRRPGANTSPNAISHLCTGRGRKYWRRGLRGKLQRATVSRGEEDGRKGKMTARSQLSKGGGRSPLPAHFRQKSWVGIIDV